MFKASNINTAIVWHYNGLRPISELKQIRTFCVLLLLQRFSLLDVAEKEFPRIFFFNGYYSVQITDIQIHDCVLLSCRVHVSGWVYALYGCLGVGGLFARGRRGVWGLRDSNWARAHSHLVHGASTQPFAKLSVRLWTKWLWIWVQLQSVKLLIN